MKFMAIFTVAYIYMYTDSKKPFYFQQGCLVSKLHTSDFLFKGLCYVSARTQREVKVCIINMILSRGSNTPPNQVDEHIINPQID